MSPVAAEFHAHFTCDPSSVTTLQMGQQDGFDVGSGPTESFCKTLTARLKGSGMRWDLPNAEAMMALAAVEQSSLWNTYWDLRRSRAA